MKLVRRTVIPLLIALMPMVAHAQLEETYDYTKEYLWGINKNSNSGLIGGIILKHSRAREERLYDTYGIELINVKHPKEQRYTSPQTGTSFIWAKQSYLYAIRLQYGRERLFFKKAPQQGVQISAGYAGGPTIGLEAPYFVLTSGGEYRPFDPDRHFSKDQIQGSGKILKGLGQSKFVPGINAKGGISFEFGAFRNNVAGVEIGLLAELYARKIVIVPTQKNRAFFPSAYFSFFWGTRR